MKSYFSIVVLLVGFAFALPIEEANKNPIENPAQQAVDIEGYKITEGDILLDEQQHDDLYKKINKKHRNGVTNPAKLWSKGIVYYKLDEEIRKFVKRTNYMKLNSKCLQPCKTRIR